MLPSNKFNQYGFPRTEADIKGITIHETGSELSARELEQYLSEECKTSQGTHYFVDDKDIVQVMPDDWAVFHSGKGYDYGNRYTIAIEICSNINDEKYKAAEDRAISLIYNLQKKYHISTDMIFFHQDWDERKFCPKTIINNYGTAKNFVYQRLEEN